MIPKTNAMAQLYVNILIFSSLSISKIVYSRDLSLNLGYLEEWEDESFRYVKWNLKNNIAYLTSYYIYIYKKNDFL